MHLRPETFVRNTSPPMVWPAPVATPVAKRRSVIRHHGGQPPPPPGTWVGAGGRPPGIDDRLPGAGEGALDGSPDGREIDATGGVDAGSRGCVQTALPGAPDDARQPAAAGTSPAASMTTSANDPRVRTLLP